MLNNTLVEKASAEEISVIRELGVWEVVDRPHKGAVVGTRWVDINSGDENKPFYLSRLVVQEYKRQADWSFFPATPPLEALRSLLICGTIEELSNDVGQPVAWTEPVVLMLIDVRRAHFYSGARRSVCGASCGILHGQEQSWPSAQEHVWMQRRCSELGFCDMPSHDCNWFRAR